MVAPLLRVELAKRNIAFDLFPDCAAKFLEVCARYPEFPE